MWFTRLRDTLRAASLKRVNPFVCAAALLLPLMVGLSFDFGYTWDEKRQQKMGEEVWEYLAGARDRSVFEIDSADQLYGELFDITCITVQKVFPRTDTYVVRHAVNAVFGWIAVVACGLLARELFGMWTGVLSMVLLASWPTFLGHSMNNPKDVPFAAFFALASYFIVKVSRAHPYVSWRYALQLTCAIALAVAVRAVGLLLFGYLGIVVAIRMAHARDFSWKHISSAGLRLGAVTVAALLLGSLVWPWALARPIYGPILGFLRLSRLPWTGTVLYRGQTIGATELPWHYVPTLFLITTPFVVLIGAAVSFLMATKDGGWRGRSAVSLLWLFFLLPIVLVIVRHSTLYDGVRHLLFLVPIFTVIAAEGWMALLRHPAQMVRRCAAVALAVTMLEPIVFDVRNHPNEVVYFNALAGGPSGAFGRYDLDYWGNCALQAAAWADSLAREANMPVVVSGGNSAHAELDARRFHSLVYRPSVRGQHHLVIQILRGSAADIHAAAASAIFRVETADGAPLCAVQAGPLYGELEARVAAVRSARGAGAEQPK